MDFLSAFGLSTTQRPAVVQTRNRLTRLFLEESADEHRLERAKRSVSKLGKCLEAEEASDCISLAYPCVRILQEMTHYNGGSLGELSCPVLLPSEMSSSQSLAVAGSVLGAETYFEWGAGSSTEIIAPLALRSYTAEHYVPWCQCLKARPVSRCLEKEAQNDTNTFMEKHNRITCVDTNLNLRSFGRLQQNGANNTHKNIADAHRGYVRAIDATRELSFDVILIDGRAHLSCALKALGYTNNASTVFVNDYPRKYGKRLLRYYDLVKTIGWDGNDCDTTQPGRCLAKLRPKPDFFGNHEVHADFISQNKNFIRSPVNF